MHHDRPSRDGDDGTQIAKRFHEQRQPPVRLVGRRLAGSDGARAGGAGAGRAGDRLAWAGRWPGCGEQPGRRSLRQPGLRLSPYPLGRLDPACLVGVDQPRRCPSAELVMQCPSGSRFSHDNRPSISWAGAERAAIPSMLHQTWASAPCARTQLALSRHTQTPPRAESGRRRCRDRGHAQSPIPGPRRTITVGRVCPAGVPLALRQAILPTWSLASRSSRLA